ncbi:MAG: YdcH family protein [Pseudomonadota bacterium]
MSQSPRIFELRRKHEALSRQIEFEQKRPSSDDLEIAALKRRKLELKDEIAKLSSHA